MLYSDSPHSTFSAACFSFQRIGNVLCRSYTACSRHPFGPALLHLEFHHSMSIKKRFSSQYMWATIHGPLSQFTWFDCAPNRASDPIWQLLFPTWDLVCLQYRFELCSWEFEISHLPSSSSSKWYLSFSSWFSWCFRFRFRDLSCSFLLLLAMPKCGSASYLGSAYLSEQAYL